MLVKTDIEQGSIRQFIVNLRQTGSTSGLNTEKKQLGGCIVLIDPLVIYFIFS